MTWPPLNREPGEFYLVPSTDRKVEIVATDALVESDGDTELEVLAYRFVNGTMIHLRTFESTKDWVRL